MVVNALQLNPAPTLWLIRHAPVLVEKGRCYGVSDWPADAAATAEAAEKLAERLPHGLHVLVSPLQRCRQLARMLQPLRPDLSFQNDTRLVELDFGAWEGRAWSTIEQGEFDQWMADFAHAAPGGNGESVASLMARVGQIWSHWGSSRTDAVWITHAGVMRAALLLAKGVHLPTAASDWPAEDLPFGEVLKLQANR